MNKLPKYWCVKNDGSELFKDTVIKYLEDVYQKRWKGDSLDNYYGYDNYFDFGGTFHSSTLKDFKNNPTLLSIQEFITLSKEEEEFILPEKFCINFKGVEDSDKIWFKSQINNSYNHNTYTNKDSIIYHFENMSSIDVGRKIAADGYTEITFEQFKEYILKQSNKETMEKEIIGWKLKDEKYLPALRALEPFWKDDLWKKNGKDYDIHNGSGAYNTFKEAGVLELWFSPVYKEEEFKVGDWVYIERAQNGAFGADNSFGRITDKYSTNGLSNDYPHGVKVDINGKVWTIGKDYDSIKIRKASIEEVKEALIAEAKKREYKQGVKVDQTPAYSGHGGIYDITGSFIDVSINTEGVFNVSVGGIDVYSTKQGIWATILPSYPNIEINGYKGEFFDEYVKFGCAKIGKQLFIQTNKLIEAKFDYGISNREIESVTIGKGTFTKEQIKEIATYYLKKK